MFHDEGGCVWYRMQAGGVRPWWEKISRGVSYAPDWAEAVAFHKLRQKSRSYLCSPPIQWAYDDMGYSSDDSVKYEKDVVSSARRADVLELSHCPRPSGSASITRKYLRRIDSVYRDRYNRSYRWINKCDSKMFGSAKLLKEFIEHDQIAWEPGRSPMDNAVDYWSLRVTNMMETQWHRPPLASPCQAVERYSYNYGDIELHRRAQLADPNFCTDIRACPIGWFPGRVLFACPHCRFAQRMGETQLLSIIAPNFRPHRLTTLSLTEFLKGRPPMWYAQQKLFEKAAVRMLCGEVLVSVKHIKLGGPPELVIYDVMTLLHVADLAQVHWSMFREIQAVCACQEPEKICFCASNNVFKLGRAPLYFGHRVDCKRDY